MIFQAKCLSFREATFFDFYNLVKNMSEKSQIYIFCAEMSALSEDIKFTIFKPKNYFLQFFLN
jgi:hypothetical protein